MKVAASEPSEHLSSFHHVEGAVQRLRVDTEIHEFCRRELCGALWDSVGYHGMRAERRGSPREGYSIPCHLAGPIRCSFPSPGWGNGNGPLAVARPDFQREGVVAEVLRRIRKEKSWSRNCARRIP